MAYTDIDKPTDYFETTTYAGGTTSITSLDFSPDWVWAKKRTGVENHGIFDSVRGATKTINSNTNSAETTRGGSLTSFDSNGWSMGGADGIISASGNDYVAWAWRGSDSTAVSNTDGSITSTVSANTTSGFSIVSYTSTGSNATVGHGLGVAPAMIIFKRRSGDTENWVVYHKSLGATKNIKLNLTDAVSTSSTRFNDTEPTSSVFSLGTSGDTNGGTSPFIAYCFSEVKSFSKISSYVGNGSSSGPMIWCGFKPAKVMIKSTGSGEDWFIWDNKRPGFNKSFNPYLQPNTSNAEYDGSGAFAELLSNGFKINGTSGYLNSSGQEYIFYAVAESPFVTSTGIPTTAR